MTSDQYQWWLEQQLEPDTIITTAGSPSLGVSRPWITEGIAPVETAAEYKRRTDEWQEYEDKLLREAGTL